MENLPDDIATLSELSDSSILSCLEERLRSKQCQSYVGQVLLSLDPLWPSLRGEHGTLLAPELAAVALHGASVVREDQSIVLCGYQASGKSVVLHQLLASLLGSLSCSLSPQLDRRIVDAMWLLQAFTSQTHVTDEGHSIASGNQALVGVRLFVQEEELVGCAFSCVLLNTADLHNFSVFQLSEVKERLVAVGITSSTAEQVMNLLMNLDLLSEGHVSQLIPSDQLDRSERQQLAEQVYTHLVRWLVCHLNSKLTPPTTIEGYAHIDLFDPPGVTPPTHSLKPVTLVDLFQHYVNEILHNMYCHRLFIWEQEQYVDDELEWEFVHVQTNQLLIEAFQQPAGVLDALSCKSAKDMSCAMTSVCHSHPDVCFTTEDDSSFVVAHFSGEVCYTVSDQWPKSNTLHQTISQQTLLSLSSSSSNLLRQLAESLSSSSPDCLFGVSWEGPLSLSHRVKQTASSLMELVTTSQPQFALCLSPHPHKTEPNKVMEVDRGFMLDQLQHFRVLDMALIQSCGYPVHLDHAHFVERYSSLLIGDKGSQNDHIEMCKAVLQKMNLTDYKIGNSQVFLKPWHLRQLNSELELFQVSARKLQQAFRRSCLRRQSERFRLESAVQSILESEEYEVNGDEATTCPPSPPPRPKHTLSHQSFAINEDEGVMVTMDGLRQTVDRNERPAPAVAQNNVSSKRKASWRKQRPSVPRDGHSPTEVEPLNQRNWYHGKISRDGAERSLKNVTFDSFLVRESEKRVGEYSLSLKHKSAVKHFRIDVKRGSRLRYELFGSQKSFRSLHELIDYYTRHCITTAGETLTSPCPHEGTIDDSPPPLPPPRKKNLSSIRRKEPPATARTNLTKTRTKSRAPMLRANTGPMTRPQSVVRSFDLSDESVDTLLKEMEIEERIVDAARRMADMPAGNRKERQQRQRSLQQAQSRLLSLRQQYHTIQERRRFIELAVNNIPSPGRRISTQF